MRKEEIVDALTEAVRQGIVTEITIEFPRSTRQRLHGDQGNLREPGRLVLNENEALLAGGGGVLREPIPPSDIQIMRGKVECSLTRLDDWPRTLADALARLSAAVTLPRIKLEEGSSR